MDYIEEGSLLVCFICEWLLFNTIWAIFQLYHDENKYFAENYT
jgi:hypothetical protein